MMILKKNFGNGIMALVNAVALLLVRQTANSAWAGSSAGISRGGK